jgi:hypothetical protein
VDHGCKIYMNQPRYKACNVYQYGVQNTHQRLVLGIDWGSLERPVMDGRELKPPGRLDEDCRRILGD